MKNLRKHINAFLADEQGAETVEWVMIAAVLASIIALSFGPTSGLGLAVTTAVTAIGNHITAM